MSTGFTLTQKDVRTVTFHKDGEVSKKYKVELNVDLKVNIRLRDIVKTILFFRKDKIAYEMDLNISSINDAVWHVINAQFQASVNDYNNNT